jgi:saccharopine dehydrogenase-like NADP-dependent oxidoreductase
MRIVLVGSGGVGDAFARIAARRDFFEQLVVADYDLSRAERTVAAVQERHPGERRFVAAQVDASDAESVANLVREHQART